MRQSPLKFLLLTGLSVLLVRPGATAWAEQAPTQKQLQTEIQRLRQELNQLKDDFRAFQEAVRRGVPEPEKLTITGFEVQGSTIDSEKLDGKLKPLTEKKLTLEELQVEVRSSIKEAYAEMSIRGVQVVIPPQEITDKPLTVEVVEPQLGFLTIEGNRFFGDKNIRRFFEGRITTTEGMLVAGSLEQQLDQANRHPDRQITAVLTPGEEPGVSDVTLKVQERRPLHPYTPFHYAAEVNNTGTPNVGRIRFSQTFQYTNLFDRDHNLSVNWQFAPAEFKNVQVVGASYVVPVSTTGHSFALYGGYSETETDAVVDTLEITGKGFTVGGQFSYKLPEFWNLESNASLSIELTQMDSNLEFGTFTVVESDVGLLPFIARYNWKHRDPWGATLGFASLRWNPGDLVPDGDPEAFHQFREESQASFLRYRVGLERYQKLLRNWTMHARFEGQFTEDNLIPAEQFRLGGAHSVRGYEQSEVSGDRALLLRTEIRSPNLPRFLTRKAADKNEQIQMVGFVDYGITSLETPIEGDPDTTDIAGTGFGLRYQLWEYFSGRVDIAWALKDGPITAAGDAVIHFSAQLNF